jgi:hypothetical protein
MADESDPPKAPANMAEPDLVAATKLFVGIGVEWPRTIPLRAPVTFGKETIEALVFQKGNFGVLKGLGLTAAGQPPLDALMTIASRLCGRPLGVIERLDPDDVEEVVDIARGFFWRCQGVGNKLSEM